MTAISTTPLLDAIKIPADLLPDVHRDHDDPARQYADARLGADAIAALIAARALQKASRSA